MILLSPLLEAARVSDPKLPLWNVYKIHSNKLDMNGYTVSILPESQVLGSLISKIIDLKKRGKVIPTTSTTEDSYMYRYILQLSDELANNNQTIQSYFTVTKLTPNSVPKAEAEQLKRVTAKADVNSFKNKGAAIASKSKPQTTPVMPGKVKVKDLRSLANELYSKDHLQFYEEDGTIMFTPYAYETLMNSGLPDSLKADLEAVNKDRNNTKDPLTGEKIPYGNKIIPSTSKIYKTLYTFKDAFIAENEFDVEAPKEWNKETLQAGDIITPDMWNPSGYFGYRRPVHIDYIERDPDDGEVVVVLDEEGFELKLVNDSLKHPYMVGGF
jgi:hypothetical protein